MKVLIHGFGRMGKLVAQATVDKYDVQIIEDIVENDAIEGDTVTIDGENGARYEINVVHRFDDVKVPDVIIDFSHPSSLDPLLRYAIAKRVPLIVGTTGHNLKQMERMEQAARSIPIVRSGNFAKGFCAFKTAIASLSEQFPCAVIRIHETHHIHKADHPSGSALDIAKTIKKSCSDKTVTIGPTVDRGAIGITSERIGEEIGTHRVTFDLGDELITLTHRALDRRAFALGAVEAAERIVGNPIGYYRLEDLL